MGQVQATENSTQKSDDGDPSKQSLQSNLDTLDDAQERNDGYIEDVANTNRGNDEGHINIQQNLDQDDEGVIQVTYAEENEDEPELQRLRRIKQFQPLIKDSERTFGLESLLGITKGLKGSSATPKEDSNYEVDHKTLAELILELQKHTENYKRKIHQDQKLLLQRLKHVEGLSVQTAQALVLGLNQTRHASEKLGEAKRIKSYAQQTQKCVADIFKRLCIIGEHLPPEDRVGHESFAARWPDLDKLYRNAIQEQQRPRMDIMNGKMSLLRASADPSVATVTMVIAEGTSSIHDDNSSSSTTHYD
ncbi:hypothetical protein BDB00DRAFT_831279 [Zychaea mexicana]|uniref:uncharacterized protein n=1 Tax=Zychaea mexicana TaxID=64656 RepID=UPI0022FEF5DF|nr:uncharacterized protein BDB00DRAFT_831279 [Zychaea mexicana]KAI9491746.1 hypothetical protein BDB00DRAFT_831279 [Zychaea mexicana]